MRSVIRLLCGAAACVAMVGGVWTLLWCGRGALAAVDIPSAGRSLMKEMDEAQALEVQSRAVKDRLAGKQEVVAALLDGRLSLHEAAEDFRLITEDTSALDDAEPEEAGCASDEAAYENLMAWIAAAACNEPRWQARAAHLHAKIDSLLHRTTQGL